MQEQRYQELQRTVQQKLQQEEQEREQQERQAQLEQQEQEQQQLGEQEAHEQLQQDSEEEMEEQEAVLTVDPEPPVSSEFSVTSYVSGRQGGMQQDGWYSQHSEQQKQQSQERLSLTRQQVQDLFRLEKQLAEHPELKEEILAAEALKVRQASSQVADATPAGTLQEEPLSTGVMGANADQPEPARLHSAAIEEAKLLLQRREKERAVSKEEVVERVSVSQQERERLGVLEEQAAALGSATSVWAVPGGIPQPQGDLRVKATGRGTGTAT
eukprot:scaffold7846_cov417-Prasinococcus_capsulatus_cf.AAC.1